MKRALRDYNEDYFGSQTLAKLAWKIVGGVIVVAIVVMLLGLGLGWFKAGTNIISPDNVKGQWQFAYDTEAQLDQIGVQWCTAQKAETAAVGQDERLQRTSQRIAVEQNYARVAATYNGRLSDAFRAKLVKPADVPDQAPPLTAVVLRLHCMD